MTNDQELSKELMAICVRNGAEIWVEKETVERLMSKLETIRDHKFVPLPTGEMINTADLVGLLKAETMEAVTRRKNGEWQDQKGNWHQKGERVCKCGQVVPYGKICGNCA
jgi:hypothetical protein